MLDIRGMVFPIAQRQSGEGCGGAKRMFCVASRGIFPYSISDTLLMHRGA